MLPVTAYGQDLRVIPAESFITSPGGVDMRTGRLVYSHTDLLAGSDDNAISLDRIMPDYTGNHANPFGSFAHNWDIWLVQADTTEPNEFGSTITIWRVGIHFGGRTVTMDGIKNQPDFTYKGDGPAKLLTFTGDRATGPAIYTFRDADGTIMTFRPMAAASECSRTPNVKPLRCAYISSLVRPDGTRFDFTYASTGSGNGNSQRLVRVASSRGPAVILEGSGSVVTRACVLNFSTVTPPASNICPANALATANYTYTSPGALQQPRLSSMTSPDGGVFGFSYSGAGTTYSMGFTEPGQGSPVMENSVTLAVDEEYTSQETVNSQAFADGRSYSYNYDYTPQATNRPNSTIMGGGYIDNTGVSSAFVYDFPIVPNSRTYPGQPCTSFPCYDEQPDEFLYWIYQATPGPVLIRDPLGRETNIDYCDPVFAAGAPIYVQDRCAVRSLPVSATDPEGITTFYKDGGNGNITEARRRPKPGSGLTDIVMSVTFNCANPASCTKPVTSTDALGNTVNRAYAAGHGGLTSEMLPPPAPGGARPLMLRTYAQRYAWIRNTSGALVQTPSPMWVLETETSCQTSAGSSSPVCDPSAPQLVKVLEYGAAGTAQSLLVKGVAMTADGQTLRTCYGYDDWGRKISETGANANLTVCP
ncbi:hypothetical protein FSZ31_01050 [Sphingorhabdus soli]|uniref:RHS repeat protein n=1 Tax=Flavisphingopyxis soli TaxID=2601267 RepID=A0A5C6UKP6_9SPHN|nr:hypothetical protein [Sphingorhabdus soli]TXC73379.1 hypothetical protein FSZ31_01050 [Sphingorhabdus soli]